MLLKFRIEGSPLARTLKWGGVVLGAAVLALVLVLGVATALVLPGLPDVSALADYRPKLPLRVYTAEGALIGEFGDERRQLVPLDQIPKSMKDAVVAVEDARFYEHGGIDTIGLVRAVFANLHGSRQGASTITQQVARNIYLSSERSFGRKLREALIALRLEQGLSKDQILEIYLNQIYLGNRAYGFASAAEAYFGKPLKNITLAEAAMLAGLPKAPGANNPVVNPRRARARQLYVLDRMWAVGFITEEQAAQAKQEPLHLRDGADPERPHAEYVAETVRQLMVEQYGASAYTRGLQVTTSLIATDQMAAYRALRKGILDYERRQPWRGPEARVELPAGAQADDDAIDEALAERPDSDDVLAAVVLEAGPKLVKVARRDGSALEIGPEGLRQAQAGLTAKAAPQVRIARGAVVRITKNARGAWEIVQLPEVEGAFVGLDPRDGAIRALVGGFDFAKSQFNHVTQAWRQPGSSFKPFIYSAALEKGFAPATVVNDAPLFFDRGTTGGQAWEPKNYDGQFEGPMTLRRALEQSKNMVTIRVLQAIGPNYAQEWVSQFGFDRDKHPAYLPMALGAGSVTPMQMAAAYGVFANGGFRVSPYLVTRVADARGNILFELKPPVLDEEVRAIPRRNAYIMDSLLQSVVRSGTGAKAYQALKRDDLYGKTGTTNDSFDTWFTGFQPTRVGVAWIGYDTPRQLGVRGETGGSLSLPVWTDYMRSALKGVPVATQSAPAGVLLADGELYYDDFPPGRAVAGLDLPAPEPAPAPGATIDPMSVPMGELPSSAQVPAQQPQQQQQQRRSILDFFR